MLALPQNTSELAERDVQYTEQEPVPISYIILVLLGAAIAAIGLSGNSLVLVVIKRTPSLQTAQNYLLGNLAVADITTIMFSILHLVPRAMSLSKGYTSYLLCMFFGYNVPVTATVASVLTSCVLAVERFNAVVRPFQSQIFRLRKETIRYAIAGTWMASAALNSPLFIYSSYNEKKQNCRHNFDKIDEINYYLVAYAVFVFLIPLLVMIACYSNIIKTTYFNTSVAPQSNVAEAEQERKKRALLKMSLTVSTVLFVSVTAGGVALGLKALNVKSKSTNGIGYFLYFFSSVCNPFIYAFQSSNYRAVFKAALKCH